MLRGRMRPACSPRKGLVFMDYPRVLGGMPAQQFLQEYWQKKPLLIRQAYAAFQTLLQPDELAGLACEEMVESRLIVAKPKVAKAEAAVAWQLWHGPFLPKDFQKLPPSHWTLLVQGVDQL